MGMDARDILVDALVFAFLKNSKSAKRAAFIGDATQRLQGRRDSAKIRRAARWREEAEEARQAEIAWGMFQAMICALPPE